MTVNVHLGDEQGLDRSRRYLRPVARLQLPDEPDLVHLAVYEWLPQFEAWATGPAVCGYSTSQGSLPEGTAVTCQQCEERRPDYERYLAPDNHPSPQMERQDAEIARLRAVVERVREECDAIDRDRERLDSDSESESFADGYADAVVRIRLSLDMRDSTDSPEGAA